MSLFFALALGQQATPPVNDLPAKYRPAPITPSTVVARVGGVDIKASDVEPLLWDWRGFDAVQDLVSYQMIKAEADKQRVNVSDADVEKAMNEFLAQAAKQTAPGKTVDQALIEQGFTKSRLFLRYRTQMLVDAMVERNFRPERLVKVSTLVFRPDNQLATALGDAIKRADAAYTRLGKGETWDAVLTSTTSDPNVVKSKGLLGWRDLGAFPAPIKDELAALKPGQVTHPVQTENGIQIFRLEVAGKDAKPADIAEMKPVFIAAGRRELLERLRKEVKIERLYPPGLGTNSQNDGN